MISKYAGNDPASTNAPVLASALGSSSVHLRRSLMHARALLRITRRRHSVLLGFGIASATALSALAATTAIHLAQHTQTVAVAVPQALPMPIAPPKASKPHKHKFLANPLHGIASWYGDVLQGHRTASGEIFDDAKLTACHRTLPFGTLVRVTDVRTAKSVVVKINDRGVLSPERVIDLSSAAAQELGILRAGIANVRLEVLGRARPEVAEASIPPVL